MSSLDRLSKRELELYRFKTDPLADDVINDYFPEQKQFLFSHLTELTNNSSQVNVAAYPSLKALHEDVLSKGSQAPTHLLIDGQQFFNKHASDIMLLLGLLSLPYCYAAANGAEVLVRSKRILDDPEKRLLETAEFVFNVMSHEAFQPKGKGSISILKVRLMHAAARWYAKQDNWNTEILGEPVNQEDMSGTNLAFSLIVIRGLKKLGKTVSNIDTLAYINYWNEIGRMLGIEEQLLPGSNKEAYVLERNIRERQFAESESGRRLTKSLLQYFERATFDSPLKGQSTSFVAYLLGDKISNMLGVKNTSFDTAIFQPYKFLFKIQNILSLKDDSYGRALVQFRLVKDAS